MWGRSLFLEGYKWKVGKGNQVYIDEDPWLMNEGGWTPVRVRDDLRGKRVMEIFNEDGAWKEDIIKEAFIPSDAETILSMARRNTSREDEIIWGADPKGIFSVKSAYNLAVKKDSQFLASSPDDSARNKMWKSVWRLKSWPKVKINLWKAMNDALPTVEKIKKKGSRD